MSRPIVLIVGSGRSGTTWLADELAARVGTHPVFEPLHCYRVSDVPHWGLRGEHAGRYLRRDDTAPDMQQFFEKLFRSEIDNAWTRQDWRRVPKWAEGHAFVERIAYRLAAHRNRRLTSRGTHSIIKLIKANLMLDWLSEHFQVDVLYVVRHPCQVIGSRIKHAWKGDLGDITAQPELMSRELHPFHSILEAARTPLQQLAVFWSVENRIPLQQLVRSNWTYFTYDACLVETERVFSAIDRMLDRSASQVNDKARPTARRRPHVVPLNDARPWHYPLSERDGAEVLDICHSFGIQLYGRSLRAQTTMEEAVI